MQRFLNKSGVQTSAFRLLIILFVSFSWDGHSEKLPVQPFTGSGQPSPLLDETRALIKFRLPFSASPMTEVQQNAGFSTFENKFTYDSLSFYMNGEPFFIHSGEMHYFRIPEGQWEDYIIKARNGGLNCISTCVYWGIHEPAENVWNFTGRYDLGRFIELCKKHEMYVILRIGPMINAETRNGGLPQWVREKLPGQYNNQLYPSPQWYLDAVKRYYTKLSEHLSKHFPSMGSNVILIQLDNETNCSWVWGRQEFRADAQETANQYLAMAKEVGFEGPFSATYWEPAFTVRPHGTLPVTGAYPLKAWNNERFPSLEHLPIKNARDHYHGFPAEVHDYPVFSAENQGGGGYYTIAPDEFPAVYNLTDIAGGTQATNYYMYAGGTNPQRYPGQWFENYFGRSVTHPDVTRMSYDLDAPIGEFQQIRQNYHYIRRLGLFLQSYGNTLQKTTLNPGIFPDTILGKTSQAAMRSNNGSGFIFVSSFVLPNDSMTEKIGFNIRMKDQDITFPLFSNLVLHRNHPIIIPFRLSIDGIDLRYSTANPLARFEYNGARHLVFYTLKNNLAEYFIENIQPGDIWHNKGAKVHSTEQGVVLVIDPAVKDNLVIIKRRNHPPVIIKTLDDEQSLKAWMINDLKGQLILTNVVPLDIDNNTLRYEYTTEHGDEAKFKLYPGARFNHNHRHRAQNHLSVFTESLQQSSLNLEYTRSGNGNYQIEIDKNSLPGAKEIYLHTSTMGFSTGFELHAGQMMVADGFFRFAGDNILSSWSAGIKRFLHKNSQLWVLEKQPGKEHYFIYNKHSGMLLAVKDNALKMVQSSESPGAAVLWLIENNGDGRYKLQHLHSELFLVVNESVPLLGSTSPKCNDLWDITHKDELYSTISHILSGLFLEQDKLAAALNTEPDKITLEMRSYLFHKSMQRFTFELEYGDYVKPDRFSFLSESEIRLK